MANQEALQQKLRMGIEAARRGDKPAAQVLLRQVVETDPGNELAWMWLASAVDSLDERRACLEHALRINPDNTRAREALRRLQPGAASAESSASRGRQSRRPQAQTRSGDEARSGPSTLVILVGALVVLAVITALIFVVVSTQQPQILSNNELAAALTLTVTPTTDPDTYTATPSPYILLVTVDITLPPTFTPTFTPTASHTPPPSPTPIPLSSFTMIYTGLDAGSAAPSLYEAAGDGSGERLLGSDLRDVAFDPSGKRIAFVREATVTTGEGENAVETTASALFIAPLDNVGAAQQLTKFDINVSGPTWAPNGIQLAFVSDFDGDDDIWTITDDGNNILKLTENESVDRDPTWSPDGSQIVFVSDLESPGLTRLFSMSATGENIHRLNSLSGNTYHPRWSPDGSRLVFVNDGSGDGDVYISDAEGQSSLLLTADDGGAEDRSPAFTPDGNWVGFASNRGGDTFQLYMMDVRGDRLVQVTDSTRDDQDLDFRPELILRLRQD
ncbi:MAG: hypothetical protein K8J31_31805 [Anaerolineae bacterium]|nr:hypothetical protein [Anaerolineae bacterium]